MEKKNLKACTLVHSFDFLNFFLSLLTCQISERNNVLSLVDGEGHVFQKIDRGDGVEVSSDHFDGKLSVFGCVEPGAKDCDAGDNIADHFQEENKKVLEIQRL